LIAHKAIYGVLEEPEAGGEIINVGEWSVLYDRHDLEFLSDF
jgi:hypothetical protein